MTLYRLYHSYGPSEDQLSEGQSDFAHKDGAINAARFWSSMYSTYHFYIRRISK